ncbi:hypothetical protein K402DRAFT_355789, partial [Aulographum hederae CBS 113979]
MSTHPPPTFTLNNSLCNPTFYTTIRSIWFSDVPPNSTTPPPSLSKKWFGRGTAAENSAFDSLCTSTARGALDSISPKNYPLPSFVDHSTDEAAAITLAAPFLSEIEVKEGTGDDAAEYRRAAETALSLFLLLDQFSRNIFRGERQGVVYTHYDRLSLALLKVILSASDSNPAASDQHPLFLSSPALRTWFYMPLMHSEALADHDLLSALQWKMIAEAQVRGDEGAVEFVGEGQKFEEMHRRILERWGRYPHRNEAVGRSTGAEEEEWLRGGGERFG